MNNEPEAHFRGWWLSGNVQNPENKHERSFSGLVVVSSTSVYRNLGQPCPLSSLTALVMCNGSSLRLAFRAREWLVVARKGVKPVRLAFRAREGWVVGGMKPLRLAFRVREGFAVGRPSVTWNASERGWDGWETPPSCVSSEGGMVIQWGTLTVLVRNQVIILMQALSLRLPFRPQSLSATLHA